MAKSDLPVIVETTIVENEGREHVPAIGQYYWFTHDIEAKIDDENEEYGYRREKKTIIDLVCITHVGTNYAKIVKVGPEQAQYEDRGWRVHFDEFWDCCEREPNAEDHIDGQIKRAETQTRALMEKVVEITRRLAIRDVQALPAAAEANALIVVSGQQDAKAYKHALVKAKEEELPTLFEAIKESNSDMAVWMRAKIAPLEANVEEQKTVIEIVDNRIFNVELYAGLVEEVEQIRKGKPAGPDAKIHLMQRRHYMDEECLFAYQTGGMEFKNLKQFDKWFAREENFKRVLPFDRTIVAFRVRRHDKERENDGSLGAFLRIQELKELDKLTFLYIRNGDQLYRLSTALEFEEKLFPDLDHHILKGGLLYGRSDRSWAMISSDHYAGLVEDYKKEQEEYEAKKAQHKKDREAYVKLSEAEQAKTREPYLSSSFPDNPEERWTPFTPETVYYDDMAKKVNDEIRQHNRIVTIIQGLLDRSEVLHPHPADWTLWTEDGFGKAIELIFDNDRALTPGEKPDFEAFRAKLNASLQTGSITVGQELAWEIDEAEKYNESARGAERHYRDRYRPYGDPGPGRLARVEKFMPRAKKCVYTWIRERKNARYSNTDEVQATLAVETKDLLNVSAYTPGDFKQFYADPRTRAEYIEWAPMLLAAEEYHAGNLKVAGKFKSRCPLTAEELAEIGEEPEKEDE